MRVDLQISVGGDLLIFAWRDDNSGMRLAGWSYLSGPIWMGKNLIQIGNPFFGGFDGKAEALPYLKRSTT